MAGTDRHAVHRTIVVVDVEGYSAPTRTLPHQLGTRAGMYAVLAEALAAAGVPMQACWHGDAGDGVVVLVPREYPKAPLVEVLPEALARAVRGHNNTSPDAARARLRLAVHAGEVAFDEHGATSPTMVAAFRLLDAAPVREALTRSPGVLAMIVSGLVFDEVVRNSTTLDPATFRPVEVAVKSFRDRAWIALPDHSYPADPAVLGRPAPTSATDSVPDVRSQAGSGYGTGRIGAGDLGVGTRGVHIAGNVYGTGAGVTIGAATGDHLTISPPSPPPAAGAAGPPVADEDPGHTLSAPHPAHTTSDRPTGMGTAAQQVHGGVTANTGGTAVGNLAGGLHIHPPPPHPPAHKPQQLGPRPAEFVGRVDQLAALDRALTIGSPAGDGGRGTGGTAVISAIGGTGGIGKTWLAQTWAHRNLDHFPDGQLSIDLRGFSPGAPRHPADVLADFLFALGVDRDDLPQDIDARAALYRTHTTGKRMLVLLDNAAAPDQVTPLLPGGDTCTVIVTSRNRLHSLITRYGARPVHIDVLTDAEARTLLNTAVGDTQTNSDAQRAVTELITLCGGFPLALGLIAARIRTHPHLLHDITSELRELGLDALDSDDPDASLGAVLSWSSRHLTEHQHTTFALLGIAPGPDIDLAASTSLIGLPTRATRRLLRALTDASLITHTPGDRYAMHDLVRTYATTTAHDHLTEPIRRAALERTVGFYLYTAHAAEKNLDPHRPPIPLDEPASGAHPQHISNLPDALAWLDAHHLHLLAAQNIATTQHLHHVVWHFAWILTTFHRRRGHRHDALAVWQAASGAADYLPVSAIRTRTFRFLGQAHAELGQHEQSVEHLNHALALAEHDHDPIEEAHTHHVLAWAWEQKGDSSQALEHARHALALYQALDQPVWEALALNQVGWYTAHLSDYDTARNYCEAALALHRHHHNRHGESATLDSLGYIEHATGHHRQAIHSYHQALILYRDLGTTTGAVETLDNLGHPYTALGQHDQARAAWQEAVELYQQLGRSVDAERVQRQLDDLGHTTDTEQSNV